MNRALFKNVILRALAWAAVVALGTVIAFAQDAASGSGQRTDGQIEMDVVHALDASPVLKNDLITAATIQSQVTLAGTVSSQSSRDLAESIVKGVPGVTGVKNNLKVGNPANDQTTAGVNPGVADNQPPADTSAPPEDTPAQGYPQDGGPGYPPDNAQGYPQQGGPGYPPQGGQGYPQQGYGQNGPYPQQPYRQQYTPAQPSQPSYVIAKGPVTVPPGTLLQLRTSEPVSSKRAAEGSPVQFTLIQDVTLGGVLAIPRGATVHGVVAEIRQAGQLAGKPELALQLTSVDLAGRSYPIQSDLFKVRGPSKTARSAGNIIGGALVGALIGGVAGGGGGAAIGAAAGGTVGTAASAATRGPAAWIPAEALVSFHLTAPVTVAPVTQEEAMRLAQGLNPGGPSLYQRGPYGRPYRYAYPYANPYPNPYYGPVYYRPYFFSGGFYYWR